MGRPLLKAWLVAEGLTRRLVSPPGDAAGVDRDVRDVIAGSLLFRSVDAMSTAVGRAWRDSWPRRTAEFVACAWSRGALSERIRRTGGCVAVASLTVLLLQTVQSGEDTPFRWILPLVLGLGGVVALVAPDPIARAWDDKRR
jgi:peptidoglycan/LPS O-acetylase OafA/YrhL